MENKSNSTLNLSAKRHATKESAVLEIQGKIEKIHCRMNNLSISGAFFEVLSSYNSPKKGDLVRVSIDLKQVGKKHIVLGHVVWSRGRGIGVSFIKTKNREKLSTNTF